MLLLMAIEKDIMEHGLLHSRQVPIMVSITMMILLKNNNFKRKFMKKILCLFVSILISIPMLLAVPTGTYYDNQGRMKVLVQPDGTIHCLDNNGYVRSTWKIVKEDSNGRFYIKPVINGQPIGAANSDNAWWNENGIIYLNLANQPQTLVRK